MSESSAATGSALPQTRMSGPLLWFNLMFLCLAVLQVFQDYLHASINGYSMYLSESILFKIFWLPFVLVAAVAMRWNREIGTALKRSPWFFGIAGIIVLSVLHIATVSFLISFISRLTFDNPFPFSTPLLYFVREQLYLAVVFYAGGFGLFLISDPDAVAHSSGADRFLEYIHINVQKKQIRLPVHNIHSIQANRPYISIHTGDSHYLHACTLKEIGGIVDPAKFVRVHRSSIVNTDYIDHYQSRSNGDYDIVLKNRQVIRMSRNYVREFRKRVF